jgi:hypothetical protein
VIIFSAAPAKSDAILGEATINDALTYSRIARRRVYGYNRSSGIKIPPALRIPSIATTAHRLFSKQIGTIVSGTTPRRIR